MAVTHSKETELAYEQQIWPQRYGFTPGHHIATDRSQIRTVFDEETIRGTNSTQYGPSPASETCGYYAHEIKSCMTEASELIERLMLPRGVIRPD